MKHILIISALLFILPQLISAQTIADAYRLSNQKSVGTARSGAMGNAFGALGGDFTSLSINPAGIGIYRSSEFVFTPVFNFNSSKLTINGANFSDNKFQPNIGNLGFVGTIKTNNSGSGIVSFNYGIGFNNVVDFNQNFYGANSNSPASFLDNVVGYANQENLSNDYLNQNIGDIEYRDWPTKLAWDNWLINPAVDQNGNDIDGQYSSLLFDGERVNQQKNFTQTGGINEFVFSGGININHKVYLGATFGLQNVNLNQLTEYTETFDNNGIGEENTYTFGEDYSLTGNGYNLKLGAIFKPIDNIRLGLSLHTPTYFTLTEEKLLFIDSKLSSSEYSDGINIFDYNFSSPWKAVFSGAVLFQKKGLISIDAEYIDYAAMRFERSSTFDQSLNNLNSEVKNSFESKLNIRVGAEYKINPEFSLRGGYEFYPDPQLDNRNLYQPIVLDNSSVIALGFGYASNGFFADFAFRNAVDQFSLKEIQPNFESLVLKNSNNKIIFTLGYKF